MDRKEYMREYMRIYYKKNKDKLKKRSRLWDIRNKENVRQRRRRYDKKHPFRNLKNSLKTKFNKLIIKGCEVKDVNLRTQL